MSHRLLCVQTAPRFGDVAGNLERATALLEEAGPADLVVLPELFASGYAFRDRAEARELAEPFPDGPTGRWLLETSRRLGGMVVAGFPERSGDRIYNAAAIAAAGEPLGVYRKIHLFGFEDECFDAGGAEPAIFEHAGLRVGVMVCFDWIFPETTRLLALAGADVVAHPANLVLPWCQRAMPVRALENGVYTATANRVGEEARPPRPRLAFTGLSTVADPLGEVLAQAPEAGEAVLEASLDVARSRDKRLASGNDRLAERRPALYGSLAASPAAGSRPTEDPDAGPETTSGPGASASATTVRD